MTRAAVATNQDMRSSWWPLAGFSLVCVGTIVAGLPIAKWAELTAWAPPAWAGESARWLVAAGLVITGLSVLRSKPILILITSLLFALTAYCCDALIEGRILRFVSGVMGSALAHYLLPIAAAAFGFIVHANPRTDRTSGRGILSLLLMAMAALGTQEGWYDWSVIAAYVGPGASKLLGQWSEECTWATILVLTAVGVSSSRTKSIHFLNALLLGALAYHCITSGYSETHTFTQPTTEGRTISIEHLSYTNVENWQWVVAGELVCLAIILLRQAVGLGSIALAFALAWMFAGLAIERSVGTMSVMRSISDAMSVGAAAQASGQGGAEAGSQPLTNWGLPLPSGRGAPVAGRSRTVVQPGPATQIRPPISSGSLPAPPPTDAELARAKELAMQRTSEAIVREITPLLWMLLIAIFAGLIGATGLLVMTPRAGHRIALLSGLWLGFGMGLVGLFSVWPRDPDQSWQSWWAAWRLSKYHVHALWLVFLGSMAMAGTWAFRRDSRISSWIHASAAAILLGTCASLTAAAILIRFGGFPNLPAWVYVVIAAGQSSLAWVLLMHLSFSAKRGVPNEVIA